MTFILNQMEEGIEMEKKLEPYHFYDIVRMMKEIFPEMELGEDNDGQLIVYTGWESTTSDGFYSPTTSDGFYSPIGEVLPPNERGRGKYLMYLRTKEEDEDE